MVRGEIAESGAADPARAWAQAARILSLDHDATGYAALGERDPVVGELQRASGWLRPVLFHSPYEAACWAVISARLRQPVAARVRDRLAAEHGGAVRVEGTEFTTFPAPRRCSPFRAPRASPRRSCGDCTRSPAQHSKGVLIAAGCSRSIPGRRSRNCASCPASAPSTHT